MGLSLPNIKTLNNIEGIIGKEMNKVLSLEIDHNVWRFLLGEER